VHSPPTKFSYPTTVNSTTSPLALSTAFDQGKGNSNGQKKMFIHPLYIFTEDPPKGAETEKTNNIKALQLQPDTHSLRKVCLVCEGIHPPRAFPQCAADAVDILQDHWTTYNFWSTSNTAQAHSHVTLCTVIIIWTGVAFSQPSLWRHKTFAIDFSSASPGISTDQEIVKRCKPCTMSHLHR